MTPSTTGNILPGFHKRCTIKADMSRLEGRLPSKIGTRGRRYWYISFEVAIKFGATSPEARIIWEEDVRHVTTVLLYSTHQFIGQCDEWSSDYHPRCILIRG